MGEQEAEIGREERSLAWTITHQIEEKKGESCFNANGADLRETCLISDAVCLKNQYLLTNHLLEHRL